LEFILKSSYIPIGYATSLFEVKNIFMSFLNQENDINKKYYFQSKNNVCKITFI